AAAMAAARLRFAGIDCANRDTIRVFNYFDEGLSFVVSVTSFCGVHFGRIASGTAGFDFAVAADDFERLPGRQFRLPVKVFFCKYRALLLCSTVSAEAQQSSRCRCTENESTNDRATRVVLHKTHSLSSLPLHEPVPRLLTPIHAGLSDRYFGAA